MNTTRQLVAYEVRGNGGELIRRYDVAGLSDTERGKARRAASRLADKRDRAYGAICCSVRLVLSDA